MRSKNVRKTSNIRFVVLWLVLVFTLMGCKTEEIDMDIEIIIEPPVSVEKEPMPEDDRVIVLNELQKEMKIFDVEEHHDGIFRLISEVDFISGSDEDMDQIIYPIVAGYMNASLDEKIVEVLDKMDESYTLEDIKWLKENVNTNELYGFITIYEREFYKYQKSH